MIKKKLDSNILEHLKKLPEDSNIVFLLSDGTIRGSLLHGTKMINEMRANHNLGILETLVLGHAYIGTELITAMVKGNDRISLEIECGGPIKGLNVESTADGDVRGYLHNNPIEIHKPLESFDMSPFFGPGFLTITKHIEKAKTPFSGRVMLEYGNIAQDLANYFLTSEQIKTLFSISIKFNSDGMVTGAGGLFLQELPGAEETILGELQDTVKGMESIGTYFSRGDSGETLINKTFDKFSPAIIAKKRVRFYCGCSKELFSSFISSMKQEEKEKLIKEGPFPLITTCHNCNSSYSFSRDELEALI